MLGAPQFAHCAWAAPFSFLQPNGRFNAAVASYKLPRVAFTYQDNVSDSDRAGGRHVQLTSGRLVKRDGVTAEHSRVFRDRVKFFGEGERWWLNVCACSNPNSRSAVASKRVFLERCST